MNRQITMAKDNQIDYWDKVANEKTFTHPINISILEELVDKNSYIVDYGCGYGRLVEQLNNDDYKNVSGFDTSIELISRGQRNGIENIFHIVSPTDLPINNNSVDCILLFAVLTCIPDNKYQIELLKLLFSKLKQGGIVFISDYYLQNNSMEMKRYDYLNGDKENYRVFSLSEGVIFRHHTKEWMKCLLKDFTIINEDLIEVKTMNRNNAEAFQIIATKKIE